MPSSLRRRSAAFTRFASATSATVFLATAMLWTGPAHADSDGPQTLTVGSQARTYVLAGAGSERRPLILAFHGGGSNGAAMAADTGLGEAAQRAGFVIAFVNGSGDTPAALTWNSGTCCGYARAWQADDVGYARALIAHLVASGQADPDRVYAVGMANGGMMAYRLAAESPELLRGVAVVAGTLDLPPTRIQTGVPVLHLHGTADDSVPYAGGIGAKAGTANGAPQPGIPVDSTIAAWVRANGVETAPTVMQLPAIAGDGTSVTRSVYATRTDPLAVVLYRINDGGHVWPGAGSGAANSAGGLTANGAIISFFQAHASAGQIGRFRKTTNARDPGSP